MLKTRIAVLVSGSGTNLQALLDAQADGKISGGEIALVVSNKADAYALERAKAAGVPAFAITKKECGGSKQFESKLLELLEEYGIELIVLAGFLAILSADFIKKYPDRIINVHPSLIPAFCGDGFYGIKVHEAALARGVKVTGATVHLVNEITDGGSILLQKAVTVEPNDTPESLQLRVMEQAEWVLLPQAVEMIIKHLKGE